MQNENINAGQHSADIVEQTHSELIQLQAALLSP